MWIVTAAPCRNTAPMLAAETIIGSSWSGASIWMMLATPTRGSSAPTT